MELTASRKGKDWYAKALKTPPLNLFANSNLIPELLKPSNELSAKLLRL
jgi:hypothetical protein